MTKTHLGREVPLCNYSSSSSSSSGHSTKSKHEHATGEEWSDRRPPQAIYCVLDYPLKEYLGIGTCGIFTGVCPIEGFKAFNAHVKHHVDARTKRTGVPPGKPLCDQIVLVQVDGFQHAFVVRDDETKAAESQVRIIEDKNFVAEMDDTLPLWLATNYYTSFAPWRSVAFCSAPDRQTAEHLIYKELALLAMEEGLEPDVSISFDLYQLRDDYRGKTLVHLTGVDEPLVPDELFRLVCTSTVGVDVLAPPMSAPSDVGKTGAVANVGTKRKNRASVTPASSENVLKRSDATLNNSTPVQAEEEIYIGAFEEVDPTAEVAAPIIEPENTEALLAEMQEFLKSDEKELVPTKKSRKVSSSKHSSSSLSSKSAQEPEKKRD